MNVAVVVPVLNEAEQIEDVLAGLAAQTQRPNQVVFVDAGSTDATVVLLNDWSQRRTEFRLTVISCPGALPGKGRNLGVQYSSADVVAFLDAGIKPSPDWLEVLLREIDGGKPGAWGRCQFKATGRTAVLVLAYSLGQLRKVPHVLPASAFTKEVFLRIGPFREDLRAGEDVLWREAYFKTYGKCSAVAANVEYTRFPSSWYSAWAKWFRYSKDIARARIQPLQVTAYFAFFGTWLLALGLGIWPLFQTLTGSYLILRGVVDPIRRSQRWNWPGSHWELYLLGPVFIFFSDLSKAAGFAAGLTRSDS